MPTNVAVTSSGSCTPIRLRVMIFSPEAGFKFEVTVVHLCSPVEKWSVVFNLFKQINGQLVQVVGVDFEAEVPAEVQAIEKMSNEGVNFQQARQFTKKVHPAVKPLDDGHAPTPAEEAKIHKEMQKAVLTA